MTSHYLYWIDIGSPDMTRVKKASRQSDTVIIFGLDGSEWLQEHQHTLDSFSNVHLILLQPHFVEQLGRALERHVNWSMVVDGNRISISDQSHYLESRMIKPHETRHHTAMEI